MLSSGQVTQLMCRESIALLTLAITHSPTQTGCADAKADAVTKGDGDARDCESPPAVVPSCHSLTHSLTHSPVTSTDEDDSEDDGE